MNGAHELLETRLDILEREHHEQGEARLHEQVKELEDLLVRHLSAWLMAALGLTTGIADGRAVADGTYRERPIRIYLDDDGEWMMLGVARTATYLARRHVELEDRVLECLRVLRAELDAAAADVEEPPAEDGPKAFSLLQRPRGMSLIFNGGRTGLHFDDAGSLGDWLNDYVAPVLNAAQTAVDQGAVSSDRIAILTADAFRNLNEAVQHYQEALR